MLHVFFAIYIISFSLGFVVITLSLLAYARSGLVAFRHFALLFVAAVLLLLCQTLTIYEQITPEAVFGSSLPAVSIALTVPGNGLLAFMICTTACEAVSLPLSLKRRIAHVLLTLAAAALGGAKEVLPHRLLWFLNDAGLVGIQVYAIIVIVGRIDSIRHERLLALVRSIATTTMVVAAAMIVQIVGQATLLAPLYLRDVQLVQILFYLAMVGLLLYYAVQYLFQPELPVSYRLPLEIAGRFGISPREREIITMMVQGYTNKVIGEKLFISSTTVKNHIYHIYQKTGVTNKIQLINLINSPK